MMKKLLSIAAAVFVLTMAIGCGVDKGEISGSDGPPEGGPPANSAHPPGLSDAEKNAPGAR
jgi:hypothetical protein